MIFWVYQALISANKAQLLQPLSQPRNRGMHLANHIFDPTHASALARIFVQHHLNGASGFKVWSRARVFASLDRYRGWASLLVRRVRQQRHTFSFFKH